MPQNGIIYYATGQQYVDEATVSACSVKDAMPDIPITVFTDRPDAADTELFDEVREVEPEIHSFLDRIPYFSKSPYDRTLFLDSDTYVTEDLTGLFSILDRFDIALAQMPAHCPNREARRENNRYIPEVPEEFPQFNCGIILYRNTAKIHNLFSDWADQLGDHLDEMNDQVHFREVLWEHDDVRFCTLSPEFNCRFPFPGAVQGQVRILHGRHPDMAAMAERLNQEQGLRVHTGDAHRRIISHPKPPVTLKYPGPGRIRHIVSRIWEMGQEQGWRATMREVRNRAKRLI